MFLTIKVNFSLFAVRQLGLNFLYYEDSSPLPHLRSPLYAVAERQHKSLMSQV